MILILFFLSLSNNNSYALRYFPYANFFNISEEKIDLFSKYLCAMKQDEEKCCACGYTYQMGDLCVDYLWNPLHHNDLNEYLKDSYVKSMLEIEEHEMTCQPILNHVSATSGHLVEHLTVVSQLYVNDTNITDCIDYKNVHLEKEFNFMPVSADGYLLYNKGCIALLNYDITIRSYLPIKIYCVRTYNLTLGMIFGVESINLLEKCIFVVDIFNDTDLEEQVNMHYCDHHRNFCEKKNKFHDLCKTYTAPIGGYRNIHCALCDNQTWDHYEKVEQCTGCPEGVCNLRKRVDRITYPISFSLIPDEHGTEYRVENMTTEFPVAEFFGIESDDAQQFKPFLCRERKDSCCNCERNCMKYQTCCIDVLWNKTFPAKTKDYKRLFIRTASDYKMNHDCVHLIPLVKENSKMYQMITYM